MLCALIFIHKWQGLHSKVDSERQIFFFFLGNFSWQFLFILRDFARNLLRRNQRRNTFHVLFWCLIWGSKPVFSSNKPTHYQLSQGNPCIHRKSLMKDSVEKQFVDWLPHTSHGSFIVYVVPTMEVVFTYITYIIGHYNPSRRIILPVTFKI